MRQRLPYRATGRVRLADPASYLQALCTTARAYAEVDERPCSARLDLGYAAIELQATAAEFSLSLHATDAGTIATLQAMVIEHLRESRQNRALSFDWVEAQARARRAYRRMTVVAARAITPRMRRITLMGSDLSAFASGGLHVSLFLPGEAGLPPAEMTETGRVVWGGEAPLLRAYTIRRIDAAAGTVEIDMLLHPAHGAAPGGDFARDARPGMVVGMAGPGGGRLPESSWLFLGGDETALPAIARMLEGLRPETTAVVRLEVCDRRDELPLASSAALDLRWLHRGDTPAARSTLLLQALRTAAFPPPGAERFVWFAAEQEIARSAKSWLRGRADFSAADYIAAGFWRSEAT
jgi:NADPH-dependent ferric siderophore reductase